MKSPDQNKYKLKMIFTREDLVSFAGVQDFRFKLVRVTQVGQCDVVAPIRHRGAELHWNHIIKFTRMKISWGSNERPHHRNHEGMGMLEKVTSKKWLECALWRRSIEFARNMQSWHYWHLIEKHLLTLHIYASRQCPLNGSKVPLTKRWRNGRCKQAFVEPSRSWFPLNFAWFRFQDQASPLSHVFYVFHTFTLVGVEFQIVVVDERFWFYVFPRLILITSERAHYVLVLVLVTVEAGVVGLKYIT